MSYYKWRGKTEKGLYTDWHGPYIEHSKQGFDTQRQAENNAESCFWNPGEYEVQEFFTEDEVIQQVAESDATGYVATQYGPMNVAVCRILSSFNEQDLYKFKSEWFEILFSNLENRYQLFAKTVDGETSCWQNNEGLAVSLEKCDLVELRDLINILLEA